MLCSLCWLAVPAAPAVADVVIDWSEATLDAIRLDRTTPPQAARALAMVHLALFDAMQVLNGNYETYLEISVAPPAGASPERAGAVAAYEVLIALFPEHVDRFNTVLERTPPTDNERALGRLVGAMMVSARANDGSGAVVPYTPGNAPGDWQPTPSSFAEGLLPQWGFVTPFAAGKVATFRRAGPPALESVEYATSFNEVKSLGKIDSTTRTAEQTLIAQFWADGAGTATPPGHWFQIARDVSLQRGNTVEENARLFALIGLAVVDAGIVAWDNKYFYNDWRPVTAIRHADTDGNPATESDPDWTPMLETPPFPSYVSGHSTFSAAGARMLALFYNTDEVVFTTTSDDVPGISRQFDRFSEAANEAGRSRIYGGIHWEYDNQDGLGLGREAAVFIFENHLRPIDQTVIEVPVSEVTRCGSIGIIPLGVLLLGVVGWRRTARMRCMP